MNETGIIWTEATWNPMSGCQKVSPGCKFCYAETIAETKRGTKAFPNGFDLTYRPHKLVEPLKLKEPSLIFVNSMSDLFWEEIPDEYRDKVLDVIEQTPQHEYQVLTKRPAIMLAYSKRRKLPPNFWAGTSIESRDYLFRMDILRQVEAEIHFISFEPLLGDVGLMDLTNIQWAITGGESGKHLFDQKVREQRALVDYIGKKWFPRADRIPWVRSIQAQCAAQGTKFFHKQWGGFRPESAGRELNGRTYNEIPRIPGKREKIANAHLEELEAKHARERAESNS